MTSLDGVQIKTALAIFPSREGFGWTVFDGPVSPVDWGVSMAARKAGTPDEKNARVMKRVESLMKEYRPGAVALEAFEGAGTRRSMRIKRFCRSVVALAAVHGIQVRVIHRDQIARCFASSRAKTRHAVATVVASFLPEIRRRLPQKRRAWDTEFPDMALFNAAALLLVHYANPEQPL